MEARNPVGSDSQAKRNLVGSDSQTKGRRLIPMNTVGKTMVVTDQANPGEKSGRWRLANEETAPDPDEYGREDGGDGSGLGMA